MIPSSCFPIYLPLIKIVISKLNDKLQIFCGSVGKPRELNLKSRFFYQSIDTLVSSINSIA